MTRSNGRGHDTDEPHANDYLTARHTADGLYVLYDRRNEGAWIETDTTLDPEELV